MRIYAIFIIILLITASQSRRKGFRGRGSMKKAAAANVGKSMASLINQLTNGDQSEDKSQLGKDIVRPINTLKLGQSYSIKDWLTYILYIILSIIVIFSCISRYSRNYEEEAMWQRIRERNNDRQKNYATLQAIAQHGVHPDRANGNIYKIRL